MKITTSQNLLNNNIFGVKKIGFDIGNNQQELAIGEIAYNAQTESFDIRVCEDFTGQQFQHTIFTVKANAAITKGQVVMFVGSEGDNLLAAPAVNTKNFNSEFLMGVAAENIPVETIGKVIWFGRLVEINTTAFNGLSNQNQVLLYLSQTTPGLLTNVRPSAPYYRGTIAAVNNWSTGNGNNGRITIRPNLGPTLQDIQNIKIENLQNYDTIVYNQTEETWENKKQHEFNSPFIVLNTNTIVEDPVVQTNGVKLKRTMSQETQIEWDENTDRWTIDGTKITKEGDLIDGGSW
jgi:hypothetical protein